MFSVASIISMLAVALHYPESFIYREAATYLVLQSVFFWRHVTIFMSVEVEGHLPRTIRDH